MAFRRSAGGDDTVAMVRLVLNDEHMAGVLREAIDACRHRLLIATANVKNLYLPTGETQRRGQAARSILDLLATVSDRNVAIRLLHSGVPSGPFLRQLKQGKPARLTMRRCPRLHAKAVIVDGQWMYLGSANLTGAGLGAKSVRRRNFEAGIWTDEVSLIDPVGDMLEAVWNGAQCPECGRKIHCPVPLEEPDL